MKILARVADIVFLARPVILIPVWGFSIFGYVCGMSNGKPWEFKILFGWKHLAVFGDMLLFSVAVGAVYVFNQIADYEVDARNEGFPLLVKSGIQKESAFWYAVLLSLASIAVPWFRGSMTLALFSAAALVLGLLYSFKPVYLSGRPVTDFLTNAFGFCVIAFGAGYQLSVEEVINRELIWSALPYFLLMCGGSISSTLPDRSGDLACGKRTTAVVLGLRGAHILTISFVIAGGIVSFYMKDFIAFFISVEFFIVDILYFIRQTRRFMEATYKITGGIAMTLAGVVYPLFIPVAGAVFLLTWLYFRLRYGISYPSLIPVSNVSKNAN